MIRSRLLLCMCVSGVAGCSVEDRAEELAVGWVEKSGRECPAPQLKIGAPEFLEPGSVSKWTLSCAQDENYLITVTRMPRSIEEFDRFPELKSVLQEGIDSGETLADGIHIMMFGPTGVFDRMYGGDWPLGDFPAVSETRASAADPDTSAQ